MNRPVLTVAVSILLGLAGTTLRLPVRWMIGFEPRPTSAESDSITRVARAVPREDPAVTLALDSLAMADGEWVSSAWGRARWRFLWVWQLGTAGRVEDAWRITVERSSGGWAPPPGFPNTMLRPRVHWMLLVGEQALIVLVGASLIVLLLRRRRHNLASVSERPGGDASDDRPPVARSAAGSVT